MIETFINLKRYRVVLEHMFLDNGGMIVRTQRKLYIIKHRTRLSNTQWDIILQKNNHSDLYINTRDPYVTRLGFMKDSKTYSEIIYYNTNIESYNISKKESLKDKLIEILL